MKDFLNQFNIQVVNPVHISSMRKVMLQDVTFGIVGVCPPLDHPPRPDEKIVPSPSASAHPRACLLDFQGLTCPSLSSLPPFLTG